MTFAAFLLAALLLQQQPPTNSTPSAPLPPDVPDIPEVEETVFVTATRSDRRLQDEPLRVEVVDREEIEEKALMTPGSVAMLLSETTGLRVQVTAPTLGAANVRVQGLRGRYTQLLADGLPLYGSGGESLGLLQVPPLDLERVEIIKGTASALYGPAALGGVINLVARRPREGEREALLNLTSQRGADATFWFAQEPVRGWAFTVLGGAHGQPRRDLDDDGWTDLAAFQRGAVRPRVFFQGQGGGSLSLTSGVIVEDRRAGTIPPQRAQSARWGPRTIGVGFDERLDTRRVDVGGVGRRPFGRALFTARGSYARVASDRTFGQVREQGTRATWFGETALSATVGRHTWVAGAALQRDDYSPVELPRFEYQFTAPALFAQNEVALGSAASLAASVRVDFHNVYGTFVSPRVSLLVRPSSEWTWRLSGGTGWYAPTPFTEETDETGLTWLATLAPARTKNEELRTKNGTQNFGNVERGVEIRAERAASLSSDLSWVRGPLELSGTLFTSRINRAVQLVALRDMMGAGAVPVTTALVNAPEPTRAWGSELVARLRRGPFVTMATYALTHAREFAFETGGRRDVPLTPRHAASLLAVWESEGWGRAGLEAYFTGRQSLDDNPYRDVSRGYVLFGGLVERRLGRARLFINIENVADVRQTKVDPLIRPSRTLAGRWTVDAWAPLDGRTVNGGIRVSF